MKTTYSAVPNMTAARHPASGQSPRFARKLLCSLAIAAGFVSSAQAAIINVNLGNAASGNALNGKAYMTGGYAQAPVSYVGTAWNDIATTPNYSVPALLDSNGNVTAVAFATTSPTAMEGPLNWADHANVPLLQGGIKRNYNSSTGNAMVQRAKVSGLTPNGLYHIAVVGCQQDKAAGEWGIGTSTLAPTTTKKIINTLPVHENWVSGDNYTIFYRVPANSSGEIYLWGKGQPAPGGYANGIVLNGIQIIDAADLQSPENTMLSFSFPGVNAVIDETAKTVTCAMYGAVNNLTPTITMSSGATCSPASGVANDFTSAQTYTVYAENGTPNAYTVTVNQLTPTITTRGDGKTLATFSAAGGGTWTIPSGVTTMEVLAVGGGGGTGSQSSGAGAGGMYSTSSYTVTAGSTVAVAVGAGGVAGPNTGGYSGSIGGSGGTTQFHQLLAYGGAASGGYDAGGDQGGHSTDGGTNVISGNVGGKSPTMTGNYGSGGGAGAPGVDSNGSAGGAGLANSISGSPLYYAGGGGTGGGAGGSSVGGHGADGSRTQAEMSGMDGRGGGAGGGWGGNIWTGGGVGGSGVLILAYIPGATTYTVSFNSNSGSSVASQEVISGGKADLPTPAPTRAGYTFVQWCSDSGLTTAFDFANTTILGATTIYAKWLINHTVSFESNGGSTVASLTVPDGTTATEPTAPTMTGYTFAGWFSDVGLTPPAFSFSTPITADTALYAKWTINSYTLTYNAGTGGSIDGTTPQTVNYLGTGTAVTALASSGWTFLKWSDNLTANPRTDSNVNSNIMVTAIFQPPFPAISTRSDGYKLATFSEGSGTWTVPAGVTSVEVLVVGGGGGNGLWTSGAGAGGMYHSTAYSVTPGSTVAVTVGAGGVAPQGNNQTATGETTKFDQLWAYGGTGGPTYRNGGDQGGYSVDGGVTVVPGVIAFHSPEGGGFFCSGSGAVGQGVGPDNAAGGIGLQCAITGTNTYYAGGGGGNASGLGGLGGGGHGSYVFGGPADAGTPNTGGGGGGSWGGTGGSGGSGVVIVAYQAITGEATTTDLVSSVPSSYLNDSVTFTATVKVGGSVVPSLPGTVEFKVDGVVKAASASIDSVTGEATYTTTELPLGTYDVVATYSGVTGTYLGSSATISQTVSNTPFNIWAATKGIPEGQAGPANDPDGDGSNNLAEFAFGGEPLSGSDNGKVFSQFKMRELSPNGTELVLTVAVLADTSETFVADGNSLIGTSTLGGITYRIEGSNDLNFSNVQVGQVASEATTAMNNVLPAGYVYRSFVLAPGGTPAKGFLRAVVVKP